MVGVLSPENKTEEIRLAVSCLQKMIKTIAAVNHSIHEHSQEEGCGFESGFNVNCTATLNHASQVHFVFVLRFG